MLLEEVAFFGVEGNLIFCKDFTDALEVLEGEHGVILGPKKTIIHDDLSTNFGP